MAKAEKDVEVAQKPKAKRGRPKKAPVVEDTVVNDTMSDDSSPADVAAAPVAQLSSVDDVTADTVSPISAEEAEFDYPVAGKGLMQHTDMDYRIGSNGFELCCRHIRHLVVRSESSSLKIGVLLNIIYNSHMTRIESSRSDWHYDEEHYEFSLLYVSAGYRRHCFKDIYDFAAYEFSLSRGSVSNFMALARRFTANKINVITGEVDFLPEFSGYSVSQLIQLLPYTDEQIKEAFEYERIYPEMSCRCLCRTMKGWYKNKPDKALPESESDTTKGRLLLNQDSSITENIQDGDYEELYQAVNDFDKAQADDVPAVEPEPEITEPDYQFDLLSLPDDLNVYAKTFDYWIKKGYKMRIMAVKK